MRFYAWGQDLPPEFEFVWQAYALFLVAAVALSLFQNMGMRFRGRNPGGFVSTILSAVIIYGIFGLTGFFAALLLTPVLLDASIATRALLGAGCLFVLFSKALKPVTGMDGCGRIFVAAPALYILCWLVVVTVGGETPSGDIDDMARPLLVALPFALFAFTASRRNPLKAVLATLLLCAFIAAFLFMPIERYGIDTQLPGAQWLVFPLVGALVVGALPLVTLLFRQSPAPAAIKAGAGIGGLLGLFWAGSRLLF